MQSITMNDSEIKFEGNSEGKWLAKISSAPSPKSCSFLISVELKPSENEVHSYYANWVVIFYKLFYRVLLTPHSITFNESLASYQSSPGSFPVKVSKKLKVKIIIMPLSKIQLFFYAIFQLGFVFCHFLIALYTLWGCTISTVFENPTSALITALYKLTYVLFGVYNVTWIILMWNVPKIAALLNQGSDIYNCLLHQNDSLKCTKKKNYKYQVIHE